MTDSPLAVRWVAAPDNWTRDGAAVKAIVVHMAEGGGTVQWLTRNDGNSSHYVVEYDGDIVQMVAENRAAGSINPRDLRTTNDPAYTYLGESIVYGKSSAVRAMGSTAYANPNRYVIAIEVEGFAADGPNAKQRASLKALINDIRRRRGALPTLGHRDFQDYKRCPGHKVPWVDYGGHATTVGYVPPSPPPVQEPDVPITAYAKPTVANIAAGTWLYDNPALQPSANNKQISPARDMPLVGKYSSTVFAVAYTDTTPTEELVPVYYASGLTPRVVAATDCTAAVDAATAPLKEQLTSATSRLNVANARIAKAATDLGTTPPPAI